VVGRYTLYDAIASGGMATVYLGRLLGPAGFSRTVAVKRLHPQFAKDPDFVGMFLDEARLAAKVRHPNVVSILDVVSVEREVFLVMDYVEGESLARLSKKARELGEEVPPAVASLITSQMLYGLHAAHEATGDAGEPLAIVHRDVSPQNVLVGLDGVARVVDFGVAKAERRLQDTEAGRLKGKVAYMAPEQVTAGEVDRRADVFAAGIVAWELWTGRRLFTGDQLVSIVERVKSEPIPAPSSVKPGIPAALDRAVMRALERDPADRYASARDMAMAFEDAVPPAVTRVVGEWVERVAGETLQKRSLLLHEVESHERSIHSSGRSLIAKIISPKAEQSATSLVNDAGVPAAGVDAEDDVATRTWEPSDSLPKRESELTVPASWDTSRRAAGADRFSTRAIALGSLVGAAVFGLALGAMVLVPGSEPTPLLERALAHAVRPPTPTAPAVGASVTTEPAPAAPKPTRAPAPRSRGPNCNPPWIKGADGITRFKRECLK
jgi:serine/threonine-protein kinase